MPIKDMIKASKKRISELQEAENRLETDEVKAVRKLFDVELRMEELEERKKYLLKNPLSVDMEKEVETIFKEINHLETEKVKIMKRISRDVHGHYKKYKQTMKVMHHLESLSEKLPKAPVKKEEPKPAKTKARRFYKPKE